MGREPAGADADGAVPLDRARHAQHAHFLFDGQAIARFHFDHRDTVCEQIVDAAHSAGKQVLIRCLPRRRNSRTDAATGLRDLFIARALETKCKFAAAIAAKNEMRVAIDQRGRDECPLQLDLLPLGVILRQIGCIPDPGNPPLLDCNRSVFDQTIARRPCDQRRGFAVGEDSACHTLAHLLTV